jgi:hypothetical protein
MTLLRHTATRDPGFQRAARTPDLELLDLILKPILSLFGRLAYVASVREPLTGCYRHHLLESTLDRDAVDHLFRTAHTDLFREWLEQPLQQQHDDFNAYLGADGWLSNSSARAWYESGILHRIPPENVAATELSLFKGDLYVLSHSHDAPEASFDIGRRRPASISSAALNVRRIAKAITGGYSNKTWRQDSGRAADSWLPVNV